MRSGSMRIPMPECFIGEGGVICSRLYDDICYNNYLNPLICVTCETYPEKRKDEWDWFGVLAFVMVEVQSALWAKQINEFEEHMIAKFGLTEKENKKDFSKFLSEED